MWELLGGKAWLGEQVRPGENKVEMDGGLCVNLIPYEACEAPCALCRWRGSFHRLLCLLSKPKFSNIHATVWYLILLFHCSDTKLSETNYKLNKHITASSELSFYYLLTCKKALFTWNLSSNHRFCVIQNR